MSPSLNASKDSNTKTNVQSVYVEEALYPDRRCERNLRESEAANRYMEKEMYVLEDELTRANRKIQRMQRKLQEYEFQLNRYQKRSPRRPNAHGYGNGYGKGKSKGYKNSSGKAPSRDASRNRRN